MDDFRHTFCEKYGLDADTVEIFLGCFQHIVVNKFWNIVEEGSFNDRFYILKSGILRAHTLVETDEQTLWFGYPGQAIFNVWCYYFGRLSPITIEAVTPSELYYITKKELEDLCADSLPICNLVRKVLIGHSAESEESNTSLFACDGGLERYLSILKRHPELLQSVPLKKLASYIHLAPQSLSRIRSQIK